MAQEKGLVTSITGDGWAQVETDRNDACSHCSSCRVSFGCNSEMTINAINRAGAQVGDLVSIQLSSGTVMKSAAILYLIPVAGLISGTFLGDELSTRVAMTKTSAVAVLSIAGFIMGYIITALISKWMSARRTLSPIITRIIRRGLVFPESSQTPFMKSPKDSHSLPGDAGSQSFQGIQEAYPHSESLSPCKMSSLSLVVAHSS